MRTRPPRAGSLWLRAIVVGLTVFVAGACARATDRQPSRPNVLLISIDSLRADHVTSLGYARPTTPTLARLAEDGTLFTNAISTTSWTLPAHVGLLTGLPDSAHGVVAARLKLGEGAQTLAEAFTAAGYRTVGFYAGPFLHPAFGFDRGFESYVDCTSYGLGTSELPPSKLHSPSHKDRTNANVLWNVTYALDQRDDRPFFFFVHMWDVHYDLVPPETHARMFDPTYPDLYAGSSYRSDPEFRTGMDARLLQHVLALYDGEIRHTDDTIAMLLDRLSETGVASDTLVVVTADHGEEFLDHGDKGHRHTLYQELIRVPLLFFWPRRVVSQRIDVPVSLIDVAPTVLDLVGLPPLTTALGRSLAPALSAGEPVGIVPVTSELAPSPRAPRTAALVLGHEKIIMDLTHRRTAYYDLAKDPGETTPVAGTDSERARMLAGRLRRMLAAARQHGARLQAASATTVDRRLRDRLEGLGYLD